MKQDRVYYYDPRDCPPNREERVVGCIILVSTVALYLLIAVILAAWWLH